MSIPPFPSQALAKLVLGYLAEEQLMTAYDEFLQASPYLDALQDEYDFMFMTSLKSIVSEYRAIKIFVGTCKPISVRKIISQCSSLLDIVKLLVSCVDLSKLSQKATNVSLEKHQLSTNNISKTNQCESCASLKLLNCVCNSKLRTQPSYNQTTYVEDSLQNSVETTPLADLPGNHVATRKKQIKVLEKDSEFMSGDGKGSLSSTFSIGDKSSFSVPVNSDASVVSINSTVKDNDTESRQKIEEFDNVLKSVVNKNNTVTGSENAARVSKLSTFQDFASGVGGQGQNSNVPDSSTSIPPPLTKEYCKDNVNSQLLLQVSNRNDSIELQSCRETVQKYSKHKVTDQKVKIISDVVTKVGTEKKVMINATSTPVNSAPLMQMKTIVINGTPAYKHNPIVTTHTYTKDEIMAMPTLILVPAPGPPKIPTSTPSQPAITKNSVSTIAGCAQSLEPLVIDVPPTSVIAKPKIISKLPDLYMPEPVQTVDITKNASVPKDNVASGVTKTPQGMLPVRKSSSTPRRTTHVRVLDFATPRRILHEAIKEETHSEPSSAQTEVLISSSPNVSFVDTSNAENTHVNISKTLDAAANSNAVEPKAECNIDTEPVMETTEIDSKQFKRSHWDADLRALIANDSLATTSSTKKRKTMKKYSKKKPAEKSDSKAEKKSSRNIISLRIKKSTKKHRKAIEEEDDEPPKCNITPEVLLKPTINIISRSDQPSNIPSAQNDVVANKSNDKEDDCVETPEGERLSLQNVIGARLNISDLLETPYKQALYDLQIGTPRFLPDLPGEPLSDIKISSIPTPRFLDTPKPVQATPSSWASRPTDYSSGGSYYKPDDQDYIPVPDWKCVVSSSSKNEVTSDKSLEFIKEDEKKSRPQRKCTKNVSYKTASSTNKAKVANDAIDAASSCSESNVTVDLTIKEALSKTQPKDKPKSSKAETKKRVSSKNKKSPVVKQKPLIKIKPRQTPTKQTPMRYKKKNDTPGYNSSHKHKRSKDVNSIVPTVVPAPTKSRRKSSTPRKLHCTKSFNSEHSDHTSPETSGGAKQNQFGDTNRQDSESEQIALRWLDPSQDTKIATKPIPSANDGDDISQIQAYIQNSDPNKSAKSTKQDKSLGSSKQGFDVETAKLIERELLDTPPQNSDSITSTDDKQLSLSVQTVTSSEAANLPAEPVNTKTDEPLKVKALETNSTKETQEILDSEDEEEEFSAYECNEESRNYITVVHNDTVKTTQKPMFKLKDNYLVDISIDDQLNVKLRATAFNLISIAEEAANCYDHKETEMAVSSISNIDRLYTPLKESFKAQVYEIFDSTLTSIDTPLKDHFSQRIDSETTVTNIAKDKEIPKASAEAKKRKRSSGSDESISDNKKTKYLLNKASIQNIDIETVLTKLHGP